MNKTKEYQENNSSPNWMHHKLKDLVDLKTIQIIHKANRHQLPHDIQSLFQISENKHNLRGICVLKKKKTART